MPTSDSFAESEVFSNLKNALSYPDGSEIRFRYLSQSYKRDDRTGKAAYPFKITSRFLDALTDTFDIADDKDTAKKKKKKHPLLLGNEGSKYSLIFADFDRPATDFGFSSYADLERALLENLKRVPGVYSVLQSGSRKPKVGFLMNGKPTVEESIQFIKTALPESILKNVELLDCSHSGLNWCFLNTSNWNKLTQDLPVMTVHSFNKIVKPKKQVPAKVAHWNMFKGDISKFGKVSKSEEAVYRFILASPFMGFRFFGLNLSSHFIAEVSGIHFTNIAKAIKSIMAKNNLKCSNFGYKKGKVARRYRASGELLAYCSELLKARTIKKTKKVILEKPENLEIEDGTWHESLWKLTWSFWSAPEFLEYVSRIEGSNEGDREQQAIEAYKCREAYRARVLNYVKKVA